MQYEDMLEGLERRISVDRQQCATVLAATVQALRETAGSEAADLQAQLPAELGQVTPAGQAPQRSLEEFLVRVGDLCGVQDVAQARSYAQGGFSVLFEAVSSGQMRQLMEALPDEYGSLAPSVSGFAGNEETLLAEVQRQAKLDSLEQARELTQAVLAVMGQAASAGQAGDLAAALPEDLGALLRSEHAAQHTEADRFFDEIIRRSQVTTPETVRSHTAGVWAVLRQWAPTELANTLNQLPRAVTDIEQ